MAEPKKSNKERLREITEGIEQGIKDLFESDKYRQYLSTMSRFHRYSVNNVTLIHMQMPGATHVAGYNRWRDQFERHVKKGEHGITIIAPTPFKKKVEEQKLDPDTKAPMLDKDGKVITEEKEIEIPMFRPVKVFDVSQTEGKPLPQLASDLTGNVQQFEAFMEALRRSAPVPVSIEPLQENMDGYFSPEKQQIVIRAGMSEVQTVSAAVHEIAHSKLHNYEKEREAAAAGTKQEAPKKKDRQTEEVEAESISYTVCQYFGIQTGENSFGYIASWSSGKELPELRASLETIQKTSTGLITDIERHFKEICKERGIDLSEQPQREHLEDGDLVLKVSAGEGKAYTYFIVQGMDKEELLSQLKSFSQATPEAGKTVEGCLTRQGAVLIPWSDSNGYRAEHFVNFYDVAYDYETGAADASELSPITQAEMLIDRAEYQKTLFSDRDKDLIVNYAYQTGDLGKTRQLLQGMAQALDSQDMPGYWAAVRQAESEIEAVQLMESSVPAQQLCVVDDAAYLHIQATEDGWDYTLYDRETMRELDGGQLDRPELPLSTAALEICRMHDMGAESIKLAPLDLVETLQEAAYQQMQQQAAETPVQPDTPAAEGVPSASMLPDAPEQALDEYPMPDKALGVADLEACGYMDGDMLPLSREQAMELFDKDLTVYAIVDGGSAEMLFDREDFEVQAPATVFALSRAEWEASPQFHEKIMERHDHQEEREAAFLAHEGDCFAIYQVNRADPDNVRFMNMDWLQSHGLAVERANYDLVYTGELTAGENTGRTLESLYEQFNLHHPADYHHPSMSVSDIVAVKQNGVVSCHYCDSLGFQEVSGFLSKDNPLKHAEMSVEDDYGMIDGIINNGPRKPTVAHLEQQARSGQPISLMDLADAVHREQHEKKRSVVEQLKSQPKQDRKKAAPKKSAEREI